MRTFLDLDSSQFIISAGNRSPVSAFAGKRADSKTFDNAFSQSGVIKELPAGTTFRFSLKKPADFQGGYLVTTTDFAKTGTGVSTLYSFSPNFNTWELNDFLVDGVVDVPVANQAARYALTGKVLGTIVRQTDTVQYWTVKDPAQLGNAAGWVLSNMKVQALCDAELEWLEPGDKRSSSATVAFYVASDINRGTEGLPSNVAINFYNKEESLALFPALYPALTGGGTALDGLITSTVSVGRVGMAVYSGQLGFWQLQTGTTAESIPGIIHPDDHHPVTNPKIWIQVL